MIFHLLQGRLRTDHGGRVQRVAGIDRGDALHGEVEELIGDVLLNQGTRRAGAHLTLVQGEHGEALEGLLPEGVVLIHDVVEEDVRGLAAKLQGDRNELVRHGLVDDLADLGGTGEGDLGDAVGRGESSTGLLAEAVDDVEHTLGQDVGDEFGDDQDRGRGLLGGLQDDRVAGREGRADLPRRHEDREVPGDDLADHAEGLVEVVGDRVLVDLRQGALLGTECAGVVAEVIDGQRDVGGECLTHGLAVVPGLGDGQHLEVLLETVGDLQQDTGALLDGGLAPGGCGGVCCVDSLLDVCRLGPGHLGEHLAVDRADVLEVLAVHGRDPLSADEVLVAGLERDQGTFGTGGSVGVASGGGSGHVSYSIWAGYCPAVGVSGYRPPT